MHVTQCSFRCPTRRVCTCASASHLCAGVCVHAGADSKGEGQASTAERRRHTSLAVQEGGEDDSAHDSDSRAARVVATGRAGGGRGGRAEAGGAVGAPDERDAHRELPPRAPAPSRAGAARHRHGIRTFSFAYTRSLLTSAEDSLITRTECVD